MGGEAEATAQELEGRRLAVRRVHNGWSQKDSAATKIAKSALTPAAYAG